MYEFYFFMIKKLLGTDIEPWIIKSFFQPFNPQFYNYYDYIEAWDRFLLFQNNIYRHTWFFRFDM